MNDDAPENTLCDTKADEVISNLRTRLRLAWRALKTQRNAGPHLRNLHGKGIQTGLDFRCGKLTRFELYPGAKGRIGDRVTIGQGVYIRVISGGELIIEDDVHINDYCRLECRGHLTIGRSSFLNVGTVIYSDGEISIGSHALIAPYVFIGDHEHSMGRRDLPIKDQDNAPASPVHIGNGVWLGTKVTVTKGVTIGEGAVIGANAVVTRDIPPMMIAAGIPAKVIRERP